MEVGVNRNSVSPRKESLKVEWVDPESWADIYLMPTYFSG